MRQTEQLDPIRIDPDDDPTDHRGATTGGELGALVRAFDWSQTSLGPKARWPQSLKTAVDILLQSPVPMVLLWGPDGVMIYNDAYSVFAGGRHPQLLGSKVLEGWPEVADFNANVMRVGLAGSTLAYRDLHLVLRRHGVPEDVWMNLDYSPVLDEDGAPAGVLAIVVETTGRVIGERRLRTLREVGSRTADVISVEAVCRAAVDAMEENQADLPTVALYLIRDEHTASVAASYGRDLRDDARQLNLRGAGERATVLEGVRATRRTAEITAEALLAPADTNGSADMLVLPVTSGEAVAGFLVVGLNEHLAAHRDYRDFLHLVATQVSKAVGTAKALEEERRRAEALAEIDRAKTEFFSNVSHEFRTPLTLMLGPAEQVLADPDTPAADRERAAVIHRNALRLLKLVNTLLDFSRIEAGRLQATYQPTDLATYTAELASNFRSAVEQAGVRLVLDTPSPSNAPPVYIDRDMWEKVVLNLLSNAFKHTFEGEIAVRVQFGETHATLEVRDTGVGIPPEQVPHVFERFHRVPNARSRTHEGTGIGLALVRELVKLHAGTIDVESTVGTGTTFTISIPLGTAHLQPDRIAASSQEARANRNTGFVEEALRWAPDPDAESVQHALKHDTPTATDERVAPGARVLVADDNADMRAYVTQLLGRHWSVEAVGDGAAALAAARERLPDLVLSDVMMPGLDGFELLRELRADPRTREVPVVLLSARAGEEARVEGLTAGADDYLVKPFTARELVARVGTTLHLGRLRKQAEAARREGEDRFRALVTASSDMVYRMSPDWREMRQLHGRDFVADTDGPSRTWLEKDIHPDDQPRVLKAIGDAVRTRTHFELEYRVVRADGSLGWTFSRAIPLVDENGDIIEWIGMASDITHRKRTEEALRSSEAQQRFLLELNDRLRPLANPIEIQYAAACALGEHTRANRVGYAEISENGESIVTVNYTNGVRGIEGRHRVADFGPALLPAFREGLTVASRDVARDTSLSDAERAAHAALEVGAMVDVPLLKDGHLVAVLFVHHREAHDYTAQEIELAEVVAARTRDAVDRARAEAALRDSEERFRRAMRIETVGVLFFGLDGRLTDANDAFQRMSGYTRDELRTVTDWMKLTPPEYAAVTAKAAEELAAHGRTTPYVKEHIRKDGSRWWGLFAPTRLGGSGLASECVEFVIDITEAKRAEAEREELFSLEQRARAAADDAYGAAEAARREAEEARRAAEAASRAKSEFLAVMSHELRTPLNAIGGYSELIEMGLRGPVTDQQRADLARIQQSQRHLLGLINQVLNYTRIDAGAVRYDLTNVPVGEALAAAEALVLPQARAQGLAYALGSVAPTLEVRADREKLQQILLNLLSNAIKFTEPGGEVRVTCTTNDEFVSISVVDTGIGIAPEKLATIFEPFVQVDQRLTRPHEGVGLGLAISRDLARGMGGDLWAESQMGRGSVFTLTLPRPAER